VPVAGADGTPGNAYSLVAASNQSLSSTDAGLPGGLTVRSFGTWFKTTSTATIVIIGWGTSATGDTKAYVSGGALFAVNASDAIAGPFVADGQWHLLVVVEDNAAGDGVKRKLYLDGRLVGGSTVLTAITLAGANRFRVGANPDATSPFTGQIDGAFVCGYAIGQAEAFSLYAKGSQDLGGSPKNAGDHVERLDAASVLFIADTLESQHTVDLGVVA
jgi:Concanavalin A-like lectin/glucanases superfamily